MGPVYSNIDKHLSTDIALPCKRAGSICGREYGKGGLGMSLEKLWLPSISPSRS
jgi:hypothetical protein